MTSPAVARFERRSAVRVPVTLHAHCQIGTRFMREAVGNLSTHGCFLRTREFAREGSAIRAALALPYADGPRYCTLVGTVARIDRDPRGLMSGLGVSFSAAEMSHVDWRNLQSYVDGACLRAP